MRIKILIIALAITYFSYSQTVYEITPSTKGNEITLTVANISETNPAENVKVFLTKKSSSLVFSKEEATIDLIDAKSEAEATFIFDVNRNVSITKKDTIEFMITDANGLMMTKQFIFSYIGPKEFKLEQNFPNPFNPTTTIQYQLPTDRKVTLIVYDILGNEVAVLVNGQKEPGYYEVDFNASQFASGVYIYRLQTGDFVSVKKMMMLK